MAGGGEEAGMMIQDTFMTRWAAGQAALLAQLGICSAASSPPTTSSR